MSVRFMDGFERYGTSGNALGRMYGKWNNIASNGNGFNLVAGRYGGSAISVETAGWTTQGLIPFSGVGLATQLVFGFNFRSTTGINSSTQTAIPMFSNQTIGNSGFRGIILSTLNTIGGFVFYSNSSIFHIPYTVGTWINIQTVVTIPVSGTPTWQVYVDGVLAGSHAATITGTFLGFVNEGNNMSTIFDDVFLIDNVVRGSEPTARIPMDSNGAAPRIDTRFPNGDVAKTWDSTGATAFDQVNDAPLTVLGKNISINGPETNQDFTLPALPTVNIPLASRIELIGRGIAAGGTFKMRANNTVVSTHNAPAELGTMSSDVISGYTLEELNSMTIGIAN